MFGNFELVVLGGGEGTRLKNVLKKKSKILSVVNGKTLLENILKNFELIKKHNLIISQNQKDIINFLKKKNHFITVNDPFVKDSKYKFEEFKNIQNNQYDAIVLAVPHSFYLKKINQIKKFLKKKAILFDIKGKVENKSNINHWSL